MNIEKLLEIYGWNGKFFLLTRDHTVEITETGEDNYNKKGTLFFYANQCYCQNDNTSEDELDKFGRNYLDRMFIALCIQVQCLCVFSTFPKVFHSLTTRKEGDKYLVRVQYDDEDLEMEVKEMFHYFIKKLERRNDGQR